MFLHLLIGFRCIFSLPQIYDEFHHTINNADHKKDLKWWSNNHGELFSLLNAWVLHINYVVNVMGGV